MASLFRASEEQERRTLTRIGALLVLSMVLIMGLLFTVNPFGQRSRDSISVAIETPYVGEGVGSGTPVIMHGVKIGQVAAVANLRGGGVRLDTILRSGPTSGLTDAIGIDFRPSNYFGVTGVNIQPKQGGRPLRSGSQLVITPDGNFALQALLYRLGELSHKVIDQRLIDVVERGTQYADALTPLLETMLIVGKAVADVQTVSTERLLRNTAGISVGFPGWVDGLARTVDASLHTELEQSRSAATSDSLFRHYVDTYDEQLKSHFISESKLAESDMDTFVYGPLKQFYDAAATDLFVKVGNLLSTHTYDLFPAVEEMRSVMAVVPGIVNAEGIGNTLRELHSRLVRMYEGSGDQRAMQVRIVLDELPGVAAPLALAVGGQG
jgi:hypothetical protein